MPSAYPHEYSSRTRFSQVEQGSNRRNEKSVNGHLGSEDERHRDASQGRDGLSRNSNRSSRPEAVPTNSSRKFITSVTTPKDSSYSSSRTPVRRANAPSQYQTSANDTSHPSAPSQPGLSQKLRSETPELRDVRTPTPRRPQVPSNSKSPIEYGSDVEDNRGTPVPRHRAHNEKRTPPDVMRSNAEYDATSSKRHHERDQNDARRDRIYDRGNEDNVRIENRAREKDKVGSYEHRREPEGTKEVERTRADRRRAYASDAEYTSSSRRTPSSNLATHRNQESEFSDGGRRPSVTTHRRHRTEDGTKTTTSDRNLQSDRLQSTRSPSEMPDTITLLQNTSSFHIMDIPARSRKPIPPSPPRVMPVYLPEQKARANHQRNISLPTDSNALAPTSVDTGGAGAREITRTSAITVTPSSKAQTNHHLRRSDTGDTNGVQYPRLAAMPHLKSAESNNNALADISASHRNGEKHGQKVGIWRTAENRVAPVAAESRLTDGVKPSARSDIQYQAEPRSTGTMRVHTPRIDPLASTYSARDLKSSTNVALHTQLPDRLTHAAAVPVSDQSTGPVSKSYSRNVATAPQQESLSVGTPQGLQLIFPSDPHPPGNPKSHRDGLDVGHATSQISSDNRLTRSALQSSGRQQDAPVASRPSATRPIGSVVTPPTAREALLSAIEKTSPLSKGVPSGARSPNALVDPVVLAEPPLRVREARVLEQSAKAEGRPLTVGHQQKSNTAPAESSQMPSALGARITQSPSTAAASLTQQLNNILSSSGKPTTRLPESLHSSTRSQAPTDTRIQTAASTPMIRQLQGQLQKLLSINKQVERETPVSSASPKIAKNSTDPPSTQHLPSLKVEDIVHESSPVVAPVDNNEPVTKPSPPFPSKTAQALASPSPRTIRNELASPDSASQNRQSASTTAEIPIAVVTKPAISQADSFEDKQDCQVKQVNISPSQARLEFSPANHTSPPEPSHLLQPLLRVFDIAATAGSKHVVSNEETDTNEDANTAEREDCADRNGTPKFCPPQLLPPTAPEQSQLSSTPSPASAVLQTTVSSATLEMISHHAGFAGSDHMPHATPSNTSTRPTHPLSSVVRSPPAQTFSLRPPSPQHTRTLPSGRALAKHGQGTTLGPDGLIQARLPVEVTRNKLTASNKIGTNVPPTPASVIMHTEDGVTSICVNTHQYHGRVESPTNVELNDSQVAPLPRERHAHLHAPSSHEGGVVRTSDSKTKPKPLAVATVETQGHRMSPGHMDSSLPSRSSPVFPRSQDRATFSPILRATSLPSPHPNKHHSNSRGNFINQSAPPAAKAPATVVSPPVSSSGLIQTSASILPSAPPARHVPVLSDHPVRTEDTPMAIISSAPNGLFSSSLAPITSTTSYRASPVQFTGGSHPVSRQSPSALSSTHPPPLRVQTFAEPGHRTLTHSRAASDPQATSMRSSAHKPASITTNQTSIVRNISTESESVLQTPSSLANSNSRPPSRTAMATPPPTSNHQPRKYDHGPEVPRAKSPQELRQGEQKEESRSHPRPSTKMPAGEQAMHDVLYRPTRTKDTLPAIVTTSHVFSASDNQVPTSSTFTPFRLGSSQKQRRVSTASIDAVNGTAANTVISSPTTSIYSQAPVLPPMRDPLIAAQEWRNKEETELNARQNARRYRPGVVFDLEEETPPNQTGHPGRYSRGQRR